MSQTDEASVAAEPEHEVFTFLRIDRRLRTLSSTEKGYKVHTNTDLTGALDKLAGSPFTSFPLRSTADHDDFRILIKGEEAGTWQHPDISVFQKHASPSQFGRGEETIMDPTYRRGTELKASDLSFLNSKKDAKEDLGKCIIERIQKDLAPAMFIGKKLQIKLYKLAIYGEGGHFDWHRDSTHSDAHHGTALFALNTEWEGGELMLRHQGVEAKLDMHPAPLDGYKDSLRPVVIAFYTDTEHKVMPVTKGVRLVLQYDVEVVGEQPPADEYDKLTPLERVTSRDFHLDSFTTYPNLDKTLIQGVIKEIKKLHEQGINIVAFPLTHLYRAASVRMEYLKGTDSALFDALNDQFDTSINPVIICYTDEGEDLGGQDCVTYIYTPEEKEDSDSKHDAYYDRDDSVVEGALFHLPVASAIRKISEEPYIEHVGNEPQMGETKYYGAGMFVKPKKKRSSSVHKGEKRDESEEVKERRLG